MPIIEYIQISINHQNRINHRMIVLTLIWMTKTEPIMKQRRFIGQTRQKISFNIQDL